jgi:hypothetical protein
MYRIFSFEELQEKVYDLVAEVPKYQNVKSHLCKARRMALGTNQNPRTSADTSFPRQQVTFPDGSDFVVSDDRNEDQRLLVLAVEDARSFLKEDETCGSCVQFMWI